jgi:hemolysin activation/secretion protein
LLVCALLVGVAGVGNAQETGQARLTKVQVLDAPHATAIHLHLDGEPASVGSDVIGDSASLVLKLENTANATGETEVDAATERAATIRLESVGRELQVVILPGRAVDPFKNYGVTATDLGILLTVGVGELALQPEEETPAPVEPSRAAQTPVAPPPVQPTPPTPVAPPVTPPQPTPTTAAAEPPAPRAAEAPPEPTPAPAEPEPPAPTPTADGSEWREATDQDIGSSEPNRADGLAYALGEVRVEYQQARPGQPLIDELMALEVGLLRTPQGYVAPRQGVRSDRVPIARPAGLPAVTFYGSAIRAMNQAIVDDFNERGLVGVLVLPHEEDIDPSSSRDLRPDGNTTLRLVVWTGVLLEYRTFASGDRIPEDQEIDNPAHTRIKDRSPVRPGELLNQRELEDYVERLNRHPGRTVDMTLTKSLEPGGVYLDFLVAESKPWSIYSQSSNTGTKETSHWRQRFGFVHNQATGHDDVLRLDYVASADFDDVHALFGTYEAPVPLGPLEDRVRVRFGGSWSKFDASEVGFSNANFEGDQWSAGTQVIGNVFQYEDVFVDAFGGGRYQHVDNDSDPLPEDPFVKQEGTANFFFSELGLRATRRTEEASLELGISGEANLPGIAGTKVRDLNRDQMGRSNVTDKNIEILRWQALATFYLEPLFPSYEDPSTPSSSTLAHEIFLQGRGQHTDDRLIPYHQAVAGGLNTVRGYEQALLAADEAIFWRGEYRLHIPRLFPIQPTPLELPLLGEFRVAPQQVYGRPDWDLILRGFVDGARLMNNDTVVGEFDSEDLWSIGAGVELQILSNFVGRIDYGYVLRDAGDDERGDDHTHLSFTIVY